MVDHLGGVGKDFCDKRVERRGRGMGIIKFLRPPPFPKKGEGSMENPGK